MRICLFGAGSKDIDEDYIKMGYIVGEKIAKLNHTLIFGGGNAGLMGAVAEGVSDNNGEIIAIFPEWMKEFQDMYPESDKEIYTSGMDDRKNKFLENADIFLVTPGGIGTLDEFFEVLMLKKLNIHNLPIIVFNYKHFYDKMLEMLDDMIDGTFIDSSNKKLYVVTSTLDETLEYL